MTTSSSAGQLAMTDGIAALQDALMVLLNGREPSTTLASDLSDHAQGLPAAAWHRVVQEVIEALMPGNVADAHEVLISTFNRLADQRLAAGAESPPATHTSSDTVDDSRERLANVGTHRMLPPVAISIKAPDAETIKVIPEIPDYALCQLEGRNGIGKTLAARLLELVSGRQPYSTLPNAWVTLRTQLHQATIDVVGLEAGRLTFELIPARWPKTSSEPIQERLGVARLNGEVISWERVRELLQVVRIAGDESLVDALGRELEE